MAFKTNWEPNKAVSRLVNIARSGHLPCNVDERVSPPTSNGRGGFRVECESIKGSYHDTKVTISVQQDPIKGSHVDVVPYTNTSGEEANRVAQELEKRYFSDDEF